MKLKCKWKWKRLNADTNRATVSFRMEQTIDKSVAELSRLSNPGLYELQRHIKAACVAQMVREIVGEEITALRALKFDVETLELMFEHGTEKQKRCRRIKEKLRTIVDGMIDPETGMKKD